MIHSHAVVGTTGGINPHFYKRAMDVENNLIDKIDRDREREKNPPACRICIAEAKALRAPLAVAA